MLRCQRLVTQAMLREPPGTTSITGQCRSLLTTLGVGLWGILRLAPAALHLPPSQMPGCLLPDTSPGTARQPHGRACCGSLRKRTCPCRCCCPCELGRWHDTHHRWHLRQGMARIQHIFGAWMHLETCSHAAGHRYCETADIVFFN